MCAEWANKEGEGAREGRIIRAGERARGRGDDAIATHTQMPEAAKLEAAAPPGPNGDPLWLGRKVIQCEITETSAFLALLKSI